MVRMGRPKMLQQRLFDDVHADEQQTETAAIWPGSATISGFVEDAPDSKLVGDKQHLRESKRLSAAAKPDAASICARQDNDLCTLSTASRNHTQRNTG
jgi:hypothetical protein